MELSESFYIFLTTTAAGLFLAILKSLYDSKCKQLDFCGVHIERDINAERDIENSRMDHNQDNRLSLDRPVNQSSMN